MLVNLLVFCISFLAVEINCISRLMLHFDTFIILLHMQLVGIALLMFCRLCMNYCQTEFMDVLTSGMYKLGVRCMQNKQCL